MNSYKFIILRNGKEILQSTIEAPTYKIALQEYLLTLKETCTEIKYNDVCIGKIINYKHLKTSKMSLTVEKSQEVKEQLFEVKVSEHGVFTLFKEDENVKIAIKNQIVTDKQFTTFEDAEAYIESKPYELLLISCYLYSKHIDEQMQLLQSIKNNDQGKSDNQN